MICIMQRTAVQVQRRSPGRGEKRGREVLKEAIPRHGFGLETSIAEANARAGGTDSIPYVKNWTG